MTEAERWEVDRERRAFARVAVGAVLDIIERGHKIRDHRYGYPSDMLIGCSVQYCDEFNERLRAIRDNYQELAVAEMGHG